MWIARTGIVASSGGASLLTNLHAVFKAESNANDSFGTNNGTAQGGLTYSTGKENNAFVFNGTNSYVYLPSNSMRFTDSFSMSCWTYTTVNQAGYRALISDYYYSGTDYGYSITIDSGNKFNLFFVGAGGVANGIVSTATLSNNTWNHLVMTWDKANTTWKAYINGVFDSSLTAAMASTIIYASGSDRTNIGTSNSSPTSGIGAGIFNGKIDEMYLWNRTLTASEVTTLYNSGTGKFYPTF